MCTYNICIFNKRVFHHVYLQHMLLKIRKTIWKVSCSLSLPLLNFQNLPISIKIPVALLQNVYICMTAISPKFSS